MIDSTSLLQMAHGWSGIATEFSIVTGSLIAGLKSRGARSSQLAWAPVIGVPLTAFAGAAVSFIETYAPGLAVGAFNAVRVGIGMSVSVGIGFAAARHLGRQDRVRPIHLRGALVAPPTAPTDGPSFRSAATRSAARGTVVTLAGVPVPAADETKHFKLIGTTGTGKSTAIHGLLSAALARGDRAVIADPDGGYLRKFYDESRGDRILNPFHPQSAKWDLFGEIAQAHDVEQIARSLIPDHEGEDRSWRNYARTYFTSVTRQAHAAGVNDVAELYRLLVIAPSTELRELVAGTAAQPFLEEHNSRMFDSIRSVTSSGVAALEHIGAQRGERLSVRSWVRGGVEHETERKSGGVLFIPYQAGQIAALRSQVSAWMRLAIFEAMNQPERDQRLWFVVDELDALGQIDGLKDALARLRKFGGRCVLGLQSISQVSSTYGSGDAHTLVENCGNTLILRCSASEGGGTARFASSLIGDREVLRMTQSRTRAPGEWASARTQTEHLNTERAVLPSEIEQLADLNGYLKLASSPHWKRVTLDRPLERVVSLPHKSSMAWKDNGRGSSEAPRAPSETHGHSR